MILTYNNKLVLDDQNKLITNNFYARKILTALLQRICNGNFNCEKKDGGKIAKKVRILTVYFEQGLFA